MSRSGSRYPSAFGHTPSYRSYVRGGTDTGPIGYSVNLPGGNTQSSYSSNFSTSNIGSPTASLLLDSEFSTPRTRVTDFGLSSGRDFGLDGLGTTNNSSSNVTSKVTKSSYSSVSDSNRGGGRPVVEFSKDSTYKSTETGPSGIPHTSYSHASSSYNSEEPYKNRVNNYSYNV